MIQEEDTDTTRSPSIHPAGYDTTPLTKQDKCHFTQKLLLLHSETFYEKKRDIVRVYIFPTLKCLSYLLHCIYIYILLDSLEWAWNMKRYTLNLNTIQNILLGKY